MEVHGSTIKELHLVSESEYQHEFSAAPLINLLKTMPNINFLKIKIYDGKLLNWFHCEPFLGEKEKITLIVDICPESKYENFHKMFFPQSIKKIDQVGYLNGIESLLMLHNASLTHVNISAFYYYQSLLANQMKKLESFKINSYDHRDSGLMNSVIMQMCKDHPRLRDVEFDHVYSEFGLEMTSEVLSVMCEMPYLRNLQLKLNQNNIMYFHYLRQLQKFTKVSLEVEQLTEEELMSLTLMSFENLQSVELLLMRKEHSIENVLKNIGRNWPNIKSFKIIVNGDSTKWILENLLQLEELTIHCNENYPVLKFKIEAMPYPNITTLCFDTRHSIIKWNNFPAAFPKLNLLKGHVRYSKDLVQILCSMENLKAVEIHIWIQSVHDIAKMSEEWKNLKELFRKVASASIIYWNHTYVSLKALHDQLQNCDFIKIKLKLDPECLCLKKV